MDSKLTKQDLRVLSVITGYLFCDSFGEAFEFAKAVVNEPIDTIQLQNRRIQSKLKGLLWEDFLKIKAKLKRLAE